MRKDFITFRLMRVSGAFGIGLLIKKSGQSTNMLSV